MAETNTAPAAQRGTDGINLVCLNRLEIDCYSISHYFSLIFYLHYFNAAKVPKWHDESRSSDKIFSAPVLIRRVPPWLGPWQSWAAWRILWRGRGEAALLGWSLGGRALRAGAPRCLLGRGLLSCARSQEPGAETNVLLAMATLLAPAEVTLGHLSSCNDGDPTSKNKYISQQLKWAYYHILIITICWLMYLSEPRDGGSSASCLVVWADDGFLAISLFFSLYFPTFQIQLLEIFFYITSYSITTN